MGPQNNIKLTVRPEAAGAYQGQFEVLPAVLTLRVEEDLLPALQSFVTRWGDFIAKRGMGPRTKYQRMLALRDRLTDTIRAGGGADLSFITEEDLRELDRDIVLGERFHSTRCPACQRDYTREELEVRQWACWWWETSRGGKRWMCPGGHTLLAHFTWIDQPPADWPAALARPADWQALPSARRG